MNAQSRLEMEKLLHTAKQGSVGMVAWFDLCNQALMAAALGRADDYDTALVQLGSRTGAEKILRAIKLAGEHMLELAQQDASGEE